MSPVQSVVDAVDTIVRRRTRYRHARYERPAADADAAEKMRFYEWDCRNDRRLKTMFRVARERCSRLIEWMSKCGGNPAPAFKLRELLRVNVDEKTLRDAWLDIKPALLAEDMRQADRPAQAGEKTPSRRRVKVKVSKDRLSVEIDGELVRLNSEADGEFVAILWKNRGTSIAAKNLEDATNRRPDHIYKRLPKILRNCIMPPGRSGKSGYLWPKCD